MTEKIVDTIRTLNSNRRADTTLIMTEAGSVSSTQIKISADDTRLVAIFWLLEQEQTRLTPYQRANGITPMTEIVRSAWTIQSAILRDFLVKLGADADYPGMRTTGKGI